MARQSPRGLPKTSSTTGGGGDHAEDHATRHSDGAGDEVDILDLAGYPGGGSDFLREDGSWAAPSGSGAPASVDYLVGTADAGLSAEIVVGTTPGGELGGTWASPTVDATHSGSAHHDQSHALDGGDHTLAGATAGHVLRATAATTFEMGQAQHSDLGGVGVDDHHAEAHVIDSTGPHAESGLTVGHVLRASAAAAFSFAALQASDIPALAYAPDDADFLVGTAQGGLSAEIVVGTAPGGELGGTWASPTVDATHSGSAHHGQSHDHSAAGDGTTLDPAVLSIPDAVTPAQTALGSAVFDSTNDILTVGDGVGRSEFGILGTATPDALSFGQAGAAGSSYETARADHAHAMPADPVTAHEGAVDPHTGYRLESADHSHATTGLQGGTIAHSALTGTTTDDHHAQSHAIDGGDHTLAGATTGHFLRANSATTFGFAAIAEGDLPSTVLLEGETPGGELGGTWASPTVDATHSGSAHHAQSHDHSAAGDGTSLDPATLSIPESATPAQTTSGEAVFDTTNEILTIGDGVGRSQFGLLGTTNPVTQNYSDAAAPGSSVETARIDHVHGMPAAGSGAPDDADYLVGTAQGGLTAEIVVGTTPGGELGGTWAAPTVDSTHSGSSHAALPTQTADLDMGGAGDIVGVSQVIEVQTTSSLGADLSLHRDDTSILNGDDLGTIYFRGDNTGGTRITGALIRAEAIETWGATDNYGTRLRFGSTQSGGLTWNVHWEIDGNGAWVPGSDSSYDIGTTSVRPATIYGDDLDITTTALIGADAYVGSTSGWGALEVYSGNNENGYFSVLSVNDAYPAKFITQRYRNSFAAVQDNDVLFDIEVQTFTGTNSATPAQLVARIDGTVAASAAPTEWVFSTSEGLTPIERWRFAPAGHLHPMTAGAPPSTGYDVGDWSFPLKSLWVGDNIGIKVASDTAQNNIEFYRSRSGPAIVADNDELGYIAWYANDGVEGGVGGAIIFARVDEATPADDDVPTELVFGTTNAGTWPTERWRISPTGDFEPMAGGSYSLGSFSAPVLYLYSNYAWMSAENATSPPLLDFYQDVYSTSLELGRIGFWLTQPTWGDAEGARISAWAEATPLAADSPSALVFYTLDDGAGVAVDPTEKWRINSAGDWLPATDSAHDIGTTSVRVATGYFDNLDSAGAITLGAETIAEADWTDLTDGGATTLHSHAGGGGAPTTVDYLVGTADGTLTNEIVVGTTPNGELGGTWGAITVDATHSGSAHSNIPTQTADLNMGTFDLDAVGDINMVGDIDGEGFGPWFHHPTTRVGITLERESTVTADDEVGNLLFYGNGWPLAAIRGFARVNAPASGDSPGALVFETVGDGSGTLTERWQIDEDGHFVPITDSLYDIGTSAARVNNIYTDGINSGGTIAVESVGAASIGAWGTEWNTFYSQFHELAVRDNVSFPQMKISRTRASSAIVADNDILGRILFTGRDTTTQIDAASITAYVDGTPGVTDMPTELRFATTADGASSTTDRLIIPPEGSIHLAESGLPSNPDSNFAALYPGNSTYPEWWTLSDAGVAGFMGPVSTVTRQTGNNWTVTNASEEITGTDHNFSSTINDTSNYATYFDVTTNAGEIRVKQAGIYRITGHVEWLANGSTGRLQLTPAINGTAFTQVGVTTPHSANTYRTGFSYVDELSANDDVGLAATHNAGSAMTITTCQLTVELIAPS